MPENNNNNPLTNDAKLAKLLQDVTTSIGTSDAALSKWRTSFLKVYQEYLDPDGVLNARDADGRLVKKLQNLAKASLKVQTTIASKNISKTQVTAEGWNVLKNLDNQMKEAEIAINVFCPKTSQDEDKVGYDKFELGAVLIKDGFHVYEIMTTTKAHILELRDGPLDGVMMDKNSLSIMDFYIRSVESFMDVMADLGLMGLAKQCVKVYEQTERPKPNQPGPNGEPPQEDYSEFVGGDKGKDPDEVTSAAPAAPTNKDKKGKHKPGKKVKQTPGQGAPGQGKPEREDADEEGKDDDDGDGGEGDFVLYWDPSTESFGKMPRAKLAPLIIQQDDKGVEVNNGAIDDSDERAELIWILKKLEKKKDKEEKAKGSWLDQIKKEKAAKSGGAAPRTRPAAKGKKKPLKAASERPASKSSGGWGPSPLEGSSSSSSSKKKGPARTKSLTKSDKSASASSTTRERPTSGPKKTSPKKAVSTPVKRNSGFEDYQGKYKSVAPKPASDGWASVSKK